MTKQLIIYRHNGGRMANQLWNFAAIYAYCLEKGYECRNYSFFKYAEFFNIPVGNVIMKILLGLGFYETYKKIVQKYFHERIISDNKSTAFYLPPTANENTDEAQKIKRLEESSSSRWYFKGWLFRNPVGIEKYRQEIREYFKPKEKIWKTAQKKISDLRKTYKHLVGVHIRRGDIVMNKEVYFVDHPRFKEILEEYLDIKKLNRSDTCFVLCSDEKIPAEVYKGLNCAYPNGNSAEDLFTLSLCDAIIGTNSTYGAFASYYGDIPLIIADPNQMDWAYYDGQKKYFENKYCTMVAYEKQYVR